MFFHAATIKKGGRFYLCYMASVLPQKFSFVGDAQVISCNYLQMCDDLKEVITTESTSPSNRYSLRLSSQLLFGLLKIHLRKVNILHVELSKFEKNLIKCYHNLQKEKRPRTKRQHPAIQNGITNGTDNLETQGNNCVTVRNISDITLEDGVLPNLNIANDNFGDIPQILDPSMNLDQVQAISIMEVDNPCFELQLRDIVVPEIRIEPPKENNRKRKSLDAPHRETLQQNPDPVPPVSSGLINTINLDAHKILQNAVIAKDDMEKVGYQTGPCPENDLVESVILEPIDQLKEMFKEKYLPFNTSMMYSIIDKQISHLMEIESDTASTISNNEFPGENAAELMDIDRQSVSLALNVENTNLPYDSRMNMDMQGNNTMRDPDASREEIATSLLLPNVSYNRTVQGSLLPDTTQFNERGPPVEVPQEMTRYTDIPIDMLEISEVPNSTTEGFNASIERTPIMVEDPPESQETKERNRILREFWDPKPLFQKIAMAQERGEKDVDIGKIVGKDTEAASLVTNRMAHVRAFTSLLKLKQSGCIKIEKKPNSTEIQHISINLDNSEE